MAPARKKTPEKLQIISLGGVMEIGKNMTAYVCKDQILVVDAGLMFPEEEMLGVDIVIPDITYLEENADKVVGIVISHGHEDHIGALPYVLRRLDVPVYGSPLTLGFVANKLVEHNLADVAKLISVEVGSTIELGVFSVEFVRVSHSIPDAAGLAIRTPAGTVFHSSDFKFDQTPVDGNMADLSRLALIGRENVLAIMCDSTNVEKSGYTPSESLVGDTFERIFATAVGRIIIAAFASNIHRVQQIYNVAARNGRRVAVVGRSMAENCRIAEELGYLKVPEGTRLMLDDIDSLDPSEVVIITTGSQGEPLSALSRMAMDEHKHIKITDGDKVIISATPIPGNEDLVLRTINRLFKQGAQVHYEPHDHVHVSGHGNQEDVKLMINLLKPMYLIPVHGEERHYAKFIELGELMGYDREHVVHMTCGDVFDITGDEGNKGERVTAGSVMVDGLGVGDVEDLVLRDRRHLSNDGVMIAVIGIDVGENKVVSGPDLFSRGFAEADYAEEIIEEARDVLVSRLDELEVNDALKEPDEVKAACKKSVAKFIYERTHRRPMVVPIIMEL